MQGLEKLKEMAGTIIQKINQYAEAERGGHGK